MRLDNDSPIPKEQKSGSEQNTKDAIKDINSIFKNSLDSDIFYGEYIVEKERKLWIQENKVTQQYVKRPEHKQRSADVFPP